MGKEFNRTYSLVNKLSYEEKLSMLEILRKDIHDNFNLPPGQSAKRTGLFYQNEKIKIIKKNRISQDDILFSSDIFGKKITYARNGGITQGFAMQGITPIVTDSVKEASLAIQSLFGIGCNKHRDVENDFDYDDLGLNVLIHDNELYTGKRTVSGKFRSINKSMNGMPLGSKLFSAWLPIRLKNKYLYIEGIPGQKLFINFQDRPTYHTASESIARALLSF